jgi:hypothetical protein
VTSDGAGRAMPPLIWPALVPVAIAASQLLVNGEQLQRRTFLLLLVLFIAAFANWLIIRRLGAWSSRWLHPAILVVLAGLSLFALFPVFSLAVFAIENRLIEGNVEPGTFSEWRLRHFFWSLIGAMGMFLPTGLRHTLPFPALGFALAGGLSFFWWLRSR